MERHESAITKLILLASKSKDQFVEVYKKYDVESAQQFYFDILGELKNKLLDRSKYDKIDFKKLIKIVAYVHELTNHETLQKYVSSANNPIQQTNFVILASKYSKFEILQYLLSNNGSALNKLTINPTFPNDVDEAGRNAFYYAIRSSNKEILSLLISQWPNDYFVSRREELDEILSRAYQELNLKNVLLSDEIRIFVEKQLLDLRFFDDDADNNSTEQVAKASSVTAIAERVKLTINNIQMLGDEYGDAEEIDGKFLYIAKFIAKNLHILKRQLKSTYDRLPWEEMEFCLAGFILANSKSDGINLFYHTILERVKILNYLKYFGEKLDDNVKSLKSVNAKELIELPKISRDKIIAQIKEDSPQFVGLYEDYERIRDIYSLKKINTYVEISLAANPRERSGQLSIMRALQVTGENMKNTLESPKLSTATNQLLLLSLPPDTQKIIINLRNSLSHANSFAISTEIEENSSDKFFVGIQSDIKHLNNVVTEILYKSKMKTIEAILKQIVNCERFDQIEPIAKSLSKMKFLEVVMELSKNVNSASVEPNKLGKLINKLDDIITDKTMYEVELFKKINSLLKAARMETVNMKENYWNGYMQVASIGYALCANKINANSFRVFKFSCNKALENCFSKTTTRPHDLKEIGLLSAKILNSVRTRALDITSNDKETKLLLEIYMELHYMVEFEEDNSKWLVDMRNQITKTTNLAVEKKTSTSRFKPEKYRKYLKDELARLKEVLNKSNACSFLSMSSEENRTVVEALILNVMSIFAKNRLTNNQLLLDEAVPVLMGKTLRNHLAHDNILVNVLHPNPAISLLVNAERLSMGDVINEKRKIGKLFREDISNLNKKHLEMSEILTNQKKLFVALESGDIDDLRSYVKSGADINGRAINLWTTLHFAAKGGNLDIVRLLLNHNLKADTTDDTGQNALHIAALYGRTDVVEFFIKLGLDVNVRDHRRLTALHMAAKNGNSDVVRVLLKAKADTDINDSRGHTPLHYAVENDYKDVVEILLHGNTNADINQTLGGFTALHIAAEYGYVKLVDFLLQNGANVNARNDKQGIPLHTTSLNGHFDVVKMLIAAGSEVNARVIDGCTALHYAVETGRDRVVDFLLESGASVNVVDKCYFNTPLHYAAKDGRLEIVKSLLKHGANVNAITLDGSTPLLLAAMDGRLEIVTILVERDVNVSARNKGGLTSLHLAAQNGHASVVSYLITNKAQIECKSFEGITPLHVASKFGHKKIVEILLAAGANPNVPDHSGFSSLHMAAMTDRVDIIQLLIESGANVKVKTDMGLTPLHIASSEGQHKAASALIGANSDVNSKASHNLTPLFAAVVAGHKSIVELLIKNGAPLNVKGDITPLNTAIDYGNKEIVEILLANGANVNVEGGEMPLSISIKNNRRDIADLLIKRGADVNARNSEALCLAVKAGYKNIVDLLLKSKADIHIRMPENHFTLLHMAVLRNHTDILSLLIQYGANVDESALGGSTPLHLAALKGNTAAVEILLANGAKVNSYSEDGTALHLAVNERGNDDIVKMLLESGSDPSIKDGKKRTPLELAVCHNHFLSVKILLQIGKSNINAKSSDDFSLLHIAAQQGNTEIAKFLIDHGADINAKNVSGSKPIHIAVREGNMETVQFFLSIGLTPEDGGAYNQTLLYYAVMTGKLDMAKFLISKGAKINVQDSLGRTPLHVAVSHGFEVVAKYLLDNGAIFNMVDNFNKTPLDFTGREGMINLLTSTGELFKAVKNKSVSDVERSINRGAAVNAKNTNDVTPLHLAICQGEENIVNVLLLKGSNSNAMAKGSTPLHYAAKFSHLHMVKALLSNEAIYNMSTVSGETPLEFATQADVISLLKLVDESFRCVRNGNLKVIRNLNKIKELDTVKAIMNACNRDKETLIVTAIRNRFPYVEQLKQLFQDNISADMEKAEVLCAQERYDEALKVYERILDSKTKLFGKNNPATLDIQHSMAKIFYKQQKYTEALTYFEDIFEKRRAILGWENKDTLNARSSIALVLHRLGKYEEAVNMFEEVFQKQKEILGTDHDHVQDTQLHMALSLDRLQRYDEALKINYDVFEKRRTKLGKNHPTTLVVQNNIAMVLNNQGKHEQALKIYRQVYESRKLVLGPSHSDTLRVLRNITGVLSDQGKFEESITAFEDLLLTQKRLLGADHIDTVYTQLSIAGIYFHQGKYHSALKYFNVGIEKGIKIMGPNHPQILESLKIVKIIKLRLKLEGNEDLDVVLDDLQKNMNIAISKGDKNAVQHFLNSGAEVNDGDSDGRTALHFAVDSGHLEIVKMLFAKGADATRITNNGNTPLHTAALKGNIEIIEILLQHVGRDKLNSFINARTRKAGATALHVAAKNGHFLIVKYLLQRGAIFNIRNNDGKSPVELAQSYANIHRLLQLVEELFRDAKNGNIEVIGKLRELKTASRDEFLAVTGTRNCLESTILQTSLVSRNKSLASKILEMLKESF